MDADPRYYNVFSGSSRRSIPATVHTRSWPVKTSSRGPAALVVAHPGHELRVHGWLSRVRPRVFVITDGSGHGPRSRVASSLALLDQAGATAGGIFGRLTDRALYDAVRERDVDLFAALALELAGALIDGEIATVVGDAVEGYNPAHDLCRLLIDSAVSVVRARGLTIANYDFAVVGPWNSDASLRVTLDDAELARKLRAASLYDEMGKEVENGIAAHGTESFRTECFRLRAPEAGLRPLSDPPFYESHDEGQVAAGIYKEVIRYGRHVAPLNAMVRAAADRAACVH